MARLAVAAVVPGEVVLAACLATGIRLPGTVLLIAEVLTSAVLGFEAFVLGRSYVAERRGGARPGQALRAAVRVVVPVQVSRVAAHELRAAGSLGLWVARRRTGIRDGDLAAPYTGPQTAMIYGLAFIALLETAALAVLIPWPLAHRIMLVLDGYGVLAILGLHAACVTRPHVIGPDGTLRIRYGALFDLTVPAAAISTARVERRYPQAWLLQVTEDGVLDLVVGNQTTVAVELAEPMEFVRPLGARGTARTIRFHADDPVAVVRALRPAVAGRGPAPAERIS